MRKLFVILLFFISICGVGFAKTQIIEKPINLVVDGVSMPAVITTPAFQHPIANILLIPGMFASDVNGNYPAMNLYPHMYADLSRQLARRGYRVLRYAKPGLGSGSTILDKKNAAKYNYFSERMVVVSAALDLLRKQSDEKCPTILAGHSEGSFVAFIVAQNADSRIDGVISLSGPAYRFFDLMIQSAEQQKEKMNKYYIKQLRDVISLVRQGKSIPAEAFANPYLSGLSQLNPVAWQYLRETDAIDPSKEIAKVKQPVLLVQGGLDGSISPENVEKLRKSRGILPTKTVFFKNLQHFYKQAKPGMNPLESSRLSGESDPRVADAIDNWIKHNINFY